MAEIKVVEGEVFVDHRGEILSANNLDFAEIKRSYTITNADTEIIRGWHGHQDEKKWFWCLRGGFTGAFVEIDNWEEPSRGLKPHIYDLCAERSQVICVPEGYANCFRATEPDSLLMVFSSKTYPECLSDSWRYEPNYWFDWNKVK
jgi:dTDP-4-dehydrorhamnose 3,5-epimerase